MIVFMITILLKSLLICSLVLYFLEKEMATHSSILAWKIPWIEEPGPLSGQRLQSMGSQRVRHDWATSFHFWWQRTLLVFLYLKMSSLCLYSWRIFSLYNSELTILFFFFFKIFFLSFSFKRLFWNPFPCHLASGSDEMPENIPIVMMYPFISGYFQGFLVLVFSSRAVTCPGTICLFFILAYSIWASLRFLNLYCHDFHQILKTGPWCIFCSILSVSHASGTPGFDILNILTL